MAAAAQQPNQRRETTVMESLQGTMNFLLTIFGQSLNQPARLRDPQQRLKMHNVFPTANIRFHEALDRMEEEIQAAQWILKRDLALHRVKEKLEAEKTLKPKPKDVVKQESDATLKKEEREGEEDVIMEDSKLKDEAKAKLEQVDGTASANTTTDQTEPVQQKQESPVTQPAPTAPSMITTTTSVGQQQPPTTTTAAGQDTSLMPTSATGEPDFSDIFGDADMGDDDGSNVANDDTQLDALADFGDSSAADVSSLPSLLPGLESFANIPDDDNPMPDAASTTASAALDATTATASNAVPEFNFGDFTSQSQTETNAQSQSQARQQNASNNNDKNNDNENAQPDFGEIDFGSFDAGGAGDGGDTGIMQDGDNTFNDLFDMDDYGFGGSADGSKGGQDVNDWVNSL